MLQYSLVLSKYFLVFLSASVTRMSCERYLGVIGPQYDPSTEAVSHVNGSCTAAEADHVRKCGSERHNQDLPARRETCVNDNNKVPGSKSRRGRRTLAQCIFLTLYFWKKER